MELESAFFPVSFTLRKAPPPVPAAGAPRVILPEFTCINLIQHVYMLQLAAGFATRSQEVLTPLNLVVFFGSAADLSMDELLPH